MSDLEFVDVATAASGATVVQESGGTSEAIEVSQAREGRPIVQLAAGPVEYIETGRHALSAAAKERIKAIRAAATPPGAPAAPPSAPAPAAPAQPPPAAPARAEVMADEDPAGDAAADGDDSDPDAPPGEGGSPAVAKTEEKPAAPASDPPPEIVATVERQTKLIDQYRAEAEAVRRELEQARAAAQSANYEVEDAYNADPATATRQFVARALGVDAKDAAVDKEMDDLIAELIASRHGVPLDQAQRAERQSVRTHRAWEAEKRRRAGQEKDTAAREQNSRAVQAARQEISRRLESFQGAPNLTRLAPVLDGRSPSEIVWEALERGVRNGTIDERASDDAMFAAAVGVAEKYYAQRADAFRAALNLGTANATGTPPGPQAGAAAANVKDDKSRQGHGPRTITNAAASVAPAPPTPQQPEPPKVRESDEDRRRRIVREHFARVTKS